MKKIPLLAVALLITGCSVAGGRAGPSRTPEAPTPSPSVVPSITPLPSGSAAADALAGREFLSTSVTVGGAHHALVPDTRIRLTFQDDRLGASAGCNSMSGTYAIHDGHLAVGAMAMTEMGCDPARMQQDQWLTGFLGMRPTIVLDGDTLTLAAGDTTITLLDREVADPDRPLIGPVWTVDSLISDDAVSSVPAGVEASLTFASDGSVQVDTGCNTGHGRYAVEGDHITFDAIGLTKKACHGSAGAMEEAVLKVLSAPSVTFEITADVLQLTTPDGNGLGLRAS